MVLVMGLEPWLLHFALVLLFSKQSNIWLEIYGESIIINLLDSSLSL